MSKLKFPEPMNVKMNIGLALTGTNKASIKFPKDEDEWEKYKKDSKTKLTGPLYVFYTSGAKKVDGDKVENFPVGIKTSDRFMLEVFSWFSKSVSLTPVDAKEFRTWATNPNNLPYIQQALTGTKDKDKKEREFIYLDAKELEMETFIKKRNATKDFEIWNKEVKESPKPKRSRKKAAPKKVEDKELEDLF